MKFIQDTLVWFYDGLANILNALVKPITDFIYDTVYFFSKFFDVIVWVLKIILGIFKLFGNQVLGLFATIGNFLSYTGSSPVSMGKYATGFSKASQLANQVGFGIFPSLISFVLVFFSVVILLKILRSE